jgi:hypothetical protein
MYWLTGILGALLVIAPFVLGFTGNPAALWTSVILGAAVVVVSAIKGWAHDATLWEYWAAGILGILAVIAPFVLGFSGLQPALYASVILGVIVLVLAGYQVLAHPQMK